MNPIHREAIESNLQSLVNESVNFNAILNLLRSQKVINDIMLRKVQLHENENCRKHELFSMIPKRGPDAFRKFIRILDKTGNAKLSKILSKNKLIEDYEDLDEYGPNRCLDRYRMDSTPRGNVLIVNIYDFDYNLNPIRVGSEKDVSSLQDLWERLGHYVIIHKNLTKNEFKEIFMDFVQSDIHVNVDSCFIFIMTHGESEDGGQSVKLSFRDNEYVSASWILNQLSTINAPHLAGRPKVVFLVACRGNGRDRGVFTESEKIMYDANDFDIVNSRLEMDGIVSRYPTLSDTLIVFPCFPGYVSLRDPDLGTFFIQELVRTFQTMAFTTHLENMLKKVMNEVKLKSQNEDTTYQIPTYNNLAFAKLLFLNPPPDF